MENSLIPSTNPFESIRHTDEKGDHWFARELYELLDYSSWQMFEKVLKRSVMACKNSQFEPKHHFNKVIKLIETAKGAQRQVDDYRLTRYASYLVAMNSDPFKTQVSLAQTYFAQQTRNAEIIQQKIGSAEDVEKILNELQALRTQMLQMGQSSEKRGFNKAVKMIIGGKTVKELVWTPD